MLTKYIILQYGGKSQSKNIITHLYQHGSNEPEFINFFQLHFLNLMFVTTVVIQMCDYLEVNIFMTQNNMLPAYTKVNQAKLIFIFTSRLSRVLVVRCTWLT